MEADAMPLAAGKAASGVAWTAGIAIFRDLVQFAVMIVLTRLLDPAAYGQFALISSIIGLCAVFSFRACLEYTLQVRGGEPDFQTQFTAGGVNQGALFVLVNGVALMCGGLDGWRTLAQPLHLMSLLFLLDWAGELRVKMLQRALDWKRLRLLEGSAFLAGAIFAVPLALMGGGVYALLIQALLLPVPFVIDLLVRARWRPSWRWDRSAFAPAWNYGWSRIGSGLAATGRQFTESAVLAQWVGFTTLGIFNRASGLASLCCLKLPSLLTLSLFPVLARLIPGSAECRRASAVVLRLVAWSVIPAAALLSLAAEPAVRLLYGERWIESAALVPAALALGSSAALFQTTSTLLLANLGQKKCFAGDLLNLAGTGACLAWLLPRGAIAYMVGAAVCQGLCVLLLLYWMIKDDVLAASDLRGAFLAPMTIAGAVLLLHSTVPWPAPIDLNPVPRWPFLITALVAAYLLLLRLSSAQPLREVLCLIPGGGRLRQLLWLGGD